MMSSSSSYASIYEHIRYRNIIGHIDKLTTPRNRPENVCEPHFFARRDHTTCCIVNNNSNNTTRGELHMSGIGGGGTMHTAVSPGVTHRSVSKTHVCNSHVITKRKIKKL